MIPTAPVCSATHNAREPKPLQTQAGIGLRHQHLIEIDNQGTNAGWLEIHAENYLSAGGLPLEIVERLRQDYPFSIHAVGLSLGSAARPSSQHLASLAQLVERMAPALVSEHLSWCSIDQTYLNDLIPLLYTEETLEQVCRNVTITQEAIKREILLENPSAYLRFKRSTISEAEFLNEVVHRTGCSLLLDVNNLFVSAHNLTFDPKAYLAALPLNQVREIHLAGHAVNTYDGRNIYIDDHGSAVIDPVWKLYEYTLTQVGPVATLIEWDNNIPPLLELEAEAQMAQTRLDLLNSAGSGA